jgi:hypothetical protein
MPKLCGPGMLHSRFAPRAGFKKFTFDKSERHACVRERQGGRVKEHVGNLPGGTRGFAQSARCARASALTRRNATVRVAPPSRAIRLRALRYGGQAGRGVRGVRRLTLRQISEVATLSTLRACDTRASFPLTHIHLRKAQMNVSLSPKEGEGIRDRGQVSAIWSRSSRSSWCCRSCARFR